MVYLWRRGSGQVFAKRQLEAALVHAEFVAEDRILLAQENGDILSWNGSSDTPPVKLATSSAMPNPWLGPSPRAVRT